MENVAPYPSISNVSVTPVVPHVTNVPITTHVPEAIQTDTALVVNSVSVTVSGCGGCGINWSRHLKNIKEVATLYFDTSLANTRQGEKVNILTGGSGSGGNRAEHARDIERTIPQITDEEIRLADVSIVIFSLSGGSGSVVGPMLIKEYAKRGSKVIGVVIADTSYGVGAKNTLGTLKTLSAIAKNNNIYLPLIVVTNDNSKTLKEVDDEGIAAVKTLINILTKDVLEVDRYDRLNWINSSKVTGAANGLKIMSFNTDQIQTNPKILLGSDSEEMTDSLLILQNGKDEAVHTQKVNPTRLKKIGVYTEPNAQIIGKVSSDISSIDAIIDRVEHMQHSAKSQKHGSIDRLATSDTNDDDLYL